jgi:hypothetical protein
MAPAPRLIARQSSLGAPVGAPDADAALRDGATCAGLDERGQSGAPPA